MKTIWQREAENKIFISLLEDSEGKHRLDIRKFYTYQEEKWVPGIYGVVVYPKDLMKGKLKSKEVEKIKYKDLYIFKSNRHGKPRKLYVGQNNRGFWAAYKKGIKLLHHSKHGNLLPDSPSDIDMESCSDTDKNEQI